VGDDRGSCRADVRGAGLERAGDLLATTGWHGSRVLGRGLCGSFRTASRGGHRPQPRVCSEVHAPRRVTRGRQQPTSDSPAIGPTPSEGPAVGGRVGLLNDGARYLAMWSGSRARLDGPGMWLQLPPTSVRAIRAAGDRISGDQQPTHDSPAPKESAGRCPRASEETPDPGVIGHLVSIRFSRPLSIILEAARKSS
jgi:hypothetical protein